MGEVMRHGKEGRRVDQALSGGKSGGKLSAACPEQEATALTLCNTYFMTEKHVVSGAGWLYGLPDFIHKNLMEMGD